MGKNKKKISEMLINSLDKKYDAEMSDAIARMAVYINNPVAIGEHPQHTEEMDKLVTQYTDARDKKESLAEMILQITY